MTTKELTKLQIVPPEGWRIGQTLFNFLEWLKEEKQVGSYSSLDRVADPFYISDELIIKYYKEYINTLK